MTQKNTWRRNLVAELDRRQVSVDDKRKILEQADRRLKGVDGNPNNVIGKPDIFAIGQIQQLRDDATGGSGPQFAVISLFAIVGSGLMSLGAMDLGAGNESFLGLPAWLVLVVGIAVFMAGLWTLPTTVFAPRGPNETSANTAWKVRLVLFGIMLATALIFFLLGRFLDFSWAI